MVALIYVIEWQKRGPPHTLILSIWDEDSKPRAPDDYDSIVCAEIPDQQQFPELYKTVTTYAAADGYPHYRRNDGQFVDKKGIQLHNRYVVLYNPYLSKKYNAHINVEIYSSMKSCKYLYKYVYKGPDMASVAVQLAGDSIRSDKKHDEIDKFVNSKFITASESYWRICGFDVHGRDPSVQ